MTLAVTPEGAETLAYSMKKGTLNVVVRPLSEEAIGEEKFFTLKELFFSGDETAGPEIEPEQRGVEIIRGLRREKYQFTNSVMEDEGRG